MPVQPPSKTRDFQALVEVVKALRGPEGCPWDKEQTHQSLTQYALEEAHELVEAIEVGNTDDMVEELGDLLLQVVLHAEVGRQAGSFELADVIQSINDKMIRRHPHVFADVDAKTSKEVLKNWAEIKAEEKKLKQGRNTHKERVFDVPVTLPALQRASKIGHKTKKLNFDWPDVSGVLEKVEEELGELKEALAQDGLNEQKHELGDLLFSLAQLARHLEFDPEQALRETNQRFENRFTTMQTISMENGQDFATLKEDELEALWQAAKKRLAKET